MKKVLRFFGNVLITLVLILAIVMTIAVVTSSRGSRVHLPNLFGYAILSVQSDSMQSDRGFYTGDLIVSKVLSEEEANNLAVDDVITFIRMSNNGVEYLETHRIVSCEGDDFVPPDEIVDGVWVRDGTHYYVTRGDNTPDIDYAAGTDHAEYASKANIYALWTGVSIPKLGTIMDFLQSSMGFMICVVLPVAAFFIYQLYIFILTLTRRQKEKALEEVSTKEEELKQKAIAEFLAKQQAEGGEAPAPAETLPAEEKAETPPEPEPEPEEKGKKKGKNKKKDKAALAEDFADDKPAEETPAADAKPEKEDKPAEEKDADKPAADAEPAPADGEEEAESADDAPAAEAKSADEVEETPKEEAKPEKEDKPAADPAPEISEEEKNRIIQEYLAKQAQEKKD